MQSLCVLSILNKMCCEKQTETLFFSSDSADMFGSLSLGTSSVVVMARKGWLATLSAKKIWPLVNTVFVLTLL